MNKLKRPFGKRISITSHLICMQKSPQEGTRSSVIVFPLHFKGHHITYCMAYMTTNLIVL